jgi:hypothetical protein
MATLAQRNFAGGELSPALYGKCDLVKYMTGLRTLRNTFVQKDGGAVNRGGFEFVAEVKDSTKTARLVPFVIGSTAYLLEFGNLYIRFYKNGVPVREATKNIIDLTQASPGVVESTAHGYSTGDHVYLSGVGGMTENNGRTLRVGSTTTDTFELKNLDGTNFDTSGLTAYTSGGTAARVYTVVTLYTEAMLPALKFTFESPASLIISTIDIYPVAKLTYSSETSWSWTGMSTLGPPSLGTPALASPPTSPNPPTAGTIVQSWKITAINDETGEESLPSAAIGGGGIASTSSTPITLLWTAVSGASRYNVYKAYAPGYFGLIGFAAQAASPSFLDNGNEVDFNLSHPQLRAAFTQAWAACCYFQRRLILGGNVASPARLIGSMTGIGLNQAYSQPVLDTDSFDLVLDGGNKLHSIRSILDLGKLVVFTSEGEWIIHGDSNGLLTPGSLNPKEHSGYGSGILSPLKIGNNAIFLQARGSVVRDLGFDLNIDGYKGNDLTAFASHLLRGKTITDWTYQQIPHSHVWAVRSDGKLLGLTYIPEQQIFAWHRHDTNGEFESVCSIPGETEDEVYAIVKRTINGSTRRYIERMKSRVFDDIKDLVLMDSALTYDGRNTGSTTMTLSGGTTWDSEDDITITASASFFSSSEVGNEIHLTGSDGTIIRLELTAYTSATVMTGTPNKLIPSGMRSVAITDWARAVDEVSGLWHLEGEEVSIFGDGYVVGSPYNPAYPTYTVEDGMVTLDACYGVIHVGLPYISDIEPLNIDTANAETLSDKHMLVKSVHGQIEQTRGLFVGPKPPTDDEVDALENLRQLTRRGSEGYDEPLSLETESFEESIPGEWNSNGRIFLRQVDPLPFTILSLKPQGEFPIRR